MTPPVVHVCRGREWRGGERQVALLARTLHRQGCRQLVVTGQGSALARALADAAVPVAAVPWRLALDPRALLGLRRAAAALGTPAPILHAHDSHALVLAGLVSRWASLPLVATRRSATVPGRWGWWHRADRVIALSGAVRAKLQQAGVSPDRIRVIPSAVDVDRLTTLPPPPWQPPGRPEVPFLLVVAALTREKGHRVLLRAHARLSPRPLLVLVGEGRERPALEALARTLGTLDDLCFAGPLDDATAAIGSARALVQPSLREALGTAVLEALALGTPVVASDTGGLREVLSSGRGVLVPPNDPAALADALTAVWAGPRRRPAPTDLSRFSLDTVADQLTQLYTSAPDATER